MFLLASVGLARDQLVETAGCPGDVSALREWFPSDGNRFDRQRV